MASYITTNIKKIKTDIKNKVKKEKKHFVEFMKQEPCINTHNVDDYKKFVHEFKDHELRLKHFIKEIKKNLNSLVLPIEKYINNIKKNEIEQFEGMVLHEKKRVKLALDDLTRKTDKIIVNPDLNKIIKLNMIFNPEIDDEIDDEYDDYIEEEDDED